MSIFNRKNRPKLPDDKDIKLMLNKLVNQSKEEYKNIENFLDIIYENNYVGNFEISNMTLEKFTEYLDNKEEELYNNIRSERNVQKTTSLFNELKSIEQIKNFINNYISPQQKNFSGKEFLNTISNKITLKKFIKILKLRQDYLKELFK